VSIDSPHPAPALYQVVPLCEVIGIIELALADQAFSIVLKFPPLKWIAWPGHPCRRMQWLVRELSQRPLASSPKRRLVSNLQPRYAQQFLLAILDLVP